MRVALVLAVALTLATPALADQQPPGQALSPPVVPGAGLSGVAGVHVTRFRVVHAQGVTAAGAFRVDFGAGPGSKLVLVRAGAQMFRALRFTSMRWADRAVVIRGVGIADGRRVSFKALAVDGGARDVFRIDWLHHAALGGSLLRGAVVIH
jgi:hypothetical protein